MSDDSGKIEQRGIEHSPGVLFARTVAGGYWVIAGRIVTQILVTIKLIIVLRLLAVDDVGLIGVATLMMGTLTSFSEIGFHGAIVQKKTPVVPYLDTAWSMEIIRGMVLYALLFAAAPFIAQMRVPPEKVELTIALVRTIGLLFMLGPLANVATIYFLKELEFGKAFVLQSASEVVDFGITITIAVVYRSIWAVVAGKIAGCLVWTVLSYCMHSYRPRFTIDRSKARELWRFGKWVLGINVCGFLLTEGDDYFVWGYAGVAALAYYQTAYRFANTPATQITAVISQVAFPAYSKLQHDIPRLRSAYLKTFALTAFLAFPCSGLIIVFARDFVVLFPGERWLPAVPAMQILALKGLERALGASRGPLFMAVGKPGVATGLQIVKLTALVALIYPFTRLWGIVGTSWLIVLIGWGAQPFGSHLAARVLQCRLTELFRPCVLPLLGTLVMAGAVTLVRAAAFPHTNLFSFAVLAVMAGLVYLIMVYVGDHFGKGEIRAIIVEQMMFLRKRQGSLYRDECS